MQLEVNMMKELLLLFCLGYYAVAVMSSETGSTFPDLLKKMEHMELLLANQFKDFEVQKKTNTEKLWNLEQAYKDSEVQKKTYTEKLWNLEQVNHGLQRQLDEQAETIERMKSEHETNQNSYVSFTASASQTREYEEGDHVLFDSVLRNYGGSYFDGNSTFICPFSAYYLFSISVRADYAKIMHARIQLDDTALVYVRAWDLITTGTASNQVVTYCEAGQSVWVLCFASGENVMEGNNGRHSTFSGTLLRLA